MEPCGPREEVGLQRCQDQVVGQEGRQGAAEDLHIREGGIKVSEREGSNYKIYCVLVLYVLFDSLLTRHTIVLIRITFQSDTLGMYSFIKDQE